MKVGTASAFPTLHSNGCKIIFRNELRYSHGQFNKTPEAKCYIDRNACDLTTMYQRII